MSEVNYIGWFALASSVALIGVQLWELYGGLKRRKQKRGPKEA